VEELRRKVVRDQLGLELEDPSGTATKKPTGLRRPPRRKPGGFGGAGQPGLPVQRGEDDEPPPRRGGGKAKNAPRGKAAMGKTAGKAGGKASGKPGARPTGRPNGKPGPKPTGRGPKPRR